MQVILKPDGSPLIIVHCCTHVFLQVWPVVSLVLVLVDEPVLAQDAVLDVLVVAQHLVQLYLQM